jgi:MSHA biogenesis protein MshP
MKRTFSYARARQAGVGLVTAIFLMVVIAGLAAALVTIFSAQQASGALDQQGTRAYQAARAGIEWGLFRQTRAASCTPSTSFALPSTSVLSGFTVTVTCGVVAGPAGSTTVIAATACNQPNGGACPNNTPAANNLDYVQRVIQVQL